MSKMDTHTLTGGCEPRDSNQEQSYLEQVFWAIIFWASIITLEEGEITPNRVSDVSEILKSIQKQER